MILGSFSGDVFFWYNSRCGENEWIVTSREEYVDEKDCPDRWLWKKSQGETFIISSA